MILLSDLGLTVYAHYPQCNRNANVFFCWVFFLCLMHNLLVEIMSEHRGLVTSGQSKNLLSLCFLFSFIFDFEICNVQIKIRASTMSCEIKQTVTSQQALLHQCLH